MDSIYPLTYEAAIAYWRAADADLTELRALAAAVDEPGARLLTYTRGLYDAYGDLLRAGLARLDHAIRTRRRLLSDADLLDLDLVCYLQADVASCLLVAEQRGDAAAADGFDRDATIAGCLLAGLTEGPVRLAAYLATHGEDAVLRDVGAAALAGLTRAHLTVDRRIREALATEGQAPEAALRDRLPGIAYEQWAARGPVLPLGELRSFLRDVTRALTAERPLSNAVVPETGRALDPDTLGDDSALDLLSAVEERIDAERTARAALPRMTPRQRQLACLAAAGLSTAQIAHRVGISPSAVRKLLRRAGRTKS